jgi:hypothetical protein
MDFSKKFRVLRLRLREWHTQGRLELKMHQRLQQAVDEMEHASHRGDKGSMAKAAGLIASAFLAFLDDMSDE